MLNPDPRAYRVALVADAVVNEGSAPFDALALLDAAEFGIVVLPPADFVLERIARTVEYTVDDLVDYRDNGYRVVVIGSSAVAQFGVWDEYLQAELGRRGIEPFERFDVAGSTRADFRMFLGASVPKALA